jgi:kinesin family protein 3/17
LSDREVGAGVKNIAKINSKRGDIFMENPLAGKSIEQPKQFTFDDIYDTDSKQERIFKETAFPIVDSVLQGYNGTIFAYGQTGTGKTHTMEGNMDREQEYGIIPRAFNQIFDYIDTCP